MKNSKYEDIVLIGFGNIYKNLLKYLITLRGRWKFNLHVIEHELYPTSRIENVCMDAHVGYRRMPDKYDVHSCLHRLYTETLIISAGNKYLFPKDIIEKDNITIINFHNALLPSYPGRNALSWAIYNGEKQVGATWHIVTADVDGGAILWQQACELSQDSKAYEAARMIMELAYQGFEEISEKLLSGMIEAVPQKIDGQMRKIYYAKDIPGNGIVRITDSPEYIYRVLRATDYGLNHVFPEIKVIVENGEVGVIKRYKKEVNGASKKNEPFKKYFLQLGEGYTLRLDIKIGGGVEYRFECPTQEEYNRLRVCVGWEAVSDYMFWQAMEHSTVIMAKDNDVAIGMARMITDGGMMSFIVDVMVQPEYQNYGIGTDMVKMLLNIQKEQLFDREFGYASVLATIGNAGFYEAMGFVERPNFILGPGMTAKIVANRLNKYER